MRIGSGVVGGSRSDRSAGDGCFVRWIGFGGVLEGCLDMREGVGFVGFLVVDVVVLEEEESAV